jgi:hypothetical protein
MWSSTSVQALGNAGSVDEESDIERANPHDPVYGRTSCRQRRNEQGQPACPVPVPMPDCVEVGHGHRHGHGQGEETALTLGVSL